MKLPNDLIKSTDYDKAKDRIIHEFECVNGKVVQHYVLGREHELTTQEIIDCLNAFATIDCDLQTAYAYIKGQEDKIADLEAKLVESETLSQRLQSVIDNLRNKSFAGSTLVDAINNVYEPIYKVKFDECEELKQQLAEKEKEIKHRHWAIKSGVYIQDKISFAVERLNLLKSQIIEWRKLYKGKFSEFSNGVKDALSDVEEEIDNQIEELKKEMK